MAQGKKYNDDLKEQAFALLTVNNSTSYVAEQLGLPISTVHTWKKQWLKEGEESDLARLRKENKEGFVNSSWRIIEKAQKLLERRITRALEKEEAIDKLLDDENLTPEQRTALKAKLATLKLENVKEVAVVLGTLYDKQALANKEATTIIEGEVTVKRFEDL